MYPSVNVVDEVMKLKTPPTYI